MLAVENLEVVYDDVVLVPRGVSLTVPEGADRRAARRQRRRQDHPAAGRHRAARRARGRDHQGPVELDGRRIDQPRRPPRSSARGVGQVMEGRRIFAELTVEENLRVGALHRAPRRLARGPRARVRPVPAAGRAAPPDRRLPVRRRAADAGDRPGADGRARATCCSTSPASAWRPAGRADPRPDRRDQPRRAPAVLLVEQNASDGAVHRRPRLRDGDRQGRARQARRRAAGRRGHPRVLPRPAAPRARQARSATSSTTGGGSGGCHEPRDRCCSRSTTCTLRFAGVTRARRGVASTVGRGELFADHRPQRRRQDLDLQLLSGVYRPQQGRVALRRRAT